MKLRVLVEAFGAALVLLLPYFSPLLYPGHKAIFHHQFPITNIIGGICLDLAVLTLAGAALLFLARRFSTPPRRLVGVLLASVMVWQGITVFVMFLMEGSAPEPVKFEYASSHFSFTDVLRLWTSHRRVALVGFALVFSILAWILPDLFHKSIRAVRFCLCAIAFSGLWIVPQLLWFAFFLQPVPAFDHSGNSALLQPNRRIVWVLFDELSQKLTSDGSSPVQLPNFNILKAESAALTNVQPFDDMTERIIPSILSHRTIRAIASSARGDLLTREKQRAGWTAYEPDRTLLGEAKADGWNPALSGWFIPYCRVFEDVLSACSWSPGTPEMIPMEKQGASQEKSILANAQVIPAMWTRQIFSWPGKSRTVEIQRHREDYLSVMAEAHKLLQNQSIGFVFVHLSIPHPPGIYDRYTHQFQDGGNYIDNLVLADDALGDLLEDIKRSSGADRTTLIVSSDHSWRVPIWRDTSHWSLEEERVSQGRFDPTPVFLVHFPGQSQSIDISEPIPEMTEYDVVLALLRKELNSPQDLERLLSTESGKADLSDGQ